MDKKLETKLQTIFENDFLHIEDDTVDEIINNEVTYYIEKLAKYRDTIDILLGVKDGAKSRAKESNEIALLIPKCEDLIEMLEDEFLSNKIKVVEFVEEIFTNQKFYELILEDIPSLSNLVDKLSVHDGNASLRDFIDWFDDEIDYLDIGSLENKNAFEYLNDKFQEFYEMYTQDLEYNLVKNIKDGETNEGTGSN